MSDEIKLTVETGAPSIQAAPEQAIAQAAEEAPR